MKMTHPLSVLVTVATLTLPAFAATVALVPLNRTHPMAKEILDLDEEWRDSNISDYGYNSLQGIQVVGSENELNMKVLTKELTQNFENEFHQNVDDESEPVMQQKTRKLTFSDQTLPQLLRAVAIASAYKGPGLLKDPVKEMPEYAVPLQSLMEKMGLTRDNKAIVFQTCGIRNELDDDGQIESRYSVVQYLVLNPTTRQGLLLFAAEGTMGDPNEKATEICGE